MKNILFVNKEKENIIAVQNVTETLTLLESGNDVFSYLNDMDEESSMSFNIDNTNYRTENTFQVVVNVKEVGKFYFVFKDKESVDLEALKAELLKLKEMDTSDDEMLIEKVNKMFLVLDTFSPLFSYSLKRNSIVNKIDISNISYCLIAIKPREKKERIIEEPKTKTGEKINKVYQTSKLINTFRDFDNWLYLFISTLMVISLGMAINLFMTSNGLAVLFVILVIAYFVFNIYIYFGYYKKDKKIFIFTRKYLSNYIYSIIGSLLGFGVFFVIGKYIRNIEEIETLMMIASISSVSSIVINIISILTAYTIKSIMNKKHK